jgi:hypothetical protein
VTFRSSRVFCTRPDVFQSPPKRRHPERSASQTYRISEGFMARSRRACPERSRRNPGDACCRCSSELSGHKLQGKLKKSQTPSETDLSRPAAEGSAVPRTTTGNAEYDTQIKLSSRPRASRIPTALATIEDFLFPQARLASTSMKSVTYMPGTFCYRHARSLRQ